MVTMRMIMIRMGRMLILILISDIRGIIVGMTLGTIAGTHRGGLIRPGMARAGVGAGAGADSTPDGMAGGTTRGIMVAGTVPVGAGEATGDRIIIGLMQHRITIIPMDVRLTPTVAAEDLTRRQIGRAGRVLLRYVAVA